VLLVLAEVLAFHFTQLATPVHVHLGPSCTQSHFTGPILFNPRIMQRLMTFSMDCAHASPRLLAEAVTVVACPSSASTTFPAVHKSSVTAEI
jgi:hypothetical protein